MTARTGRKALAYAVALFAAGAICGAVFTPRPEPKAPAPIKLGRQSEIAAKLRDKFRCSLDLTPAQLKKIDPFIIKASEEVELSHLNCVGKIMAVYECLDSQIWDDLTPAQQEKLKALEAERCKSMKQKYNYPPEMPNLKLP